jgi:hypothetical protein
MQTLNLTDAVSVQQIFEQISRMLPFQVNALGDLGSVVPEYPNQLALVANVGVFSYSAVAGGWVTAESTALALELANLQQTVTNLAAYLNTQLTEINEAINSVEVTAGQVSGLTAFIRDTTLSGLALDNGSPIAEGSTILQAAGRLQRQINDLATALAGVDLEVDTKIAALVASSPATLDTLKELADALGQDPNFATTVTNALAAKFDKAGGALTGPLSFAAPVSVASAATTNIGAATSNLVTITGAATITALGTAVAGAIRFVTFSGTPLLTHNAASLILPGAANIAAAAGDVGVFESLGGGNWRCTSYQVAAARPVLLSGAQTVTGAKRFSQVVAARLDAAAEGGAFYFERASDSVSHYYWQASGAGTTPVMRLVNAARGAQTLSVDHSGNLVAEANVTGYSDERLKKDWEPLAADFTSRLARVKYGTYTRIDNGIRQAGVSAQSLREVLPETVVEDERSGILSVAYGQAALVACVELAREVIALRAEVQALRGV